VFQIHCTLEYHINATLDAEHFINVIEKKEKYIIEQLDSDRFFIIQTVIVTYKASTIVLFYWCYFRIVQATKNRIQ